MIYQVKVGKPPAFYDVCIDSVEKYCHKYGIDHVVQTEPILKIRPLKSHRSKQAVEKLGYLPIFEKEVAFNYLPDYNAIAIIDADIYIQKDAPNIFDELGDVDFAGVRECDMPLTPQYINKIKKFSHGQYGNLRHIMKDWNSTYGHPFYNMGLMLMGNKFVDTLEGQTPTEFLRRKEFVDFINGTNNYKWSTDQTLMNFHVVKSGMKVKNLDWKWNALVKAIKDDMLPQAYFLHFFLAAKFQRKGVEIPDIIKDLSKLKRIKGHG